jgi:MerR family transcriptional regulator, heat shock protein HspR
MENISIPVTSPVYTLSTASSLSGIPVHSIRQYIDKGLILPYHKKTNRHLFSPIDILRLKYIQKLLNDDGLNIAGIRALFSLIPCWAIHSCSTEEREKCQAYNNDKFPCWEASEKGPECKNTDCRGCDVYRIVESYPDVKTYVRRMLI